MNTRQTTSGLFSQPVLRTNSKKNNIINNGVKIWNDIALDKDNSNPKSISKRNTGYGSFQNI